MACERLVLPSGTAAIVCGTRRRRQHCCKCGAVATQLCDWKTPTKRNPGKTCDKPVCSSCTTSPAPDKDLCPGHGEAYAAWKAKPR